MSGKVTSFDVFDTVLARRCGSPESAMYFVGLKLKRRGLIVCEVATFAEQRRSAENRCWGRAGGAGTTLEEIYAELGEARILIRGKEEEAATVEREFEVSVCEPVAPIRAHLERARREGVVAFLSDTCLSSGDLSRMLDRHDLRRSDDILWVSSERGRWKNDGGLFRDFAEAHPRVEQPIEHHGNDANADVSQARRAGWRARELSEGNLNVAETTLDEFRFGSAGLGPLLAGASPEARLRMGAGTPERETLHAVATSVAAPALIGFVIWLLKQSQEAGLRRLFFLSRDGHIILELARILAPKLGVEIDCRYLYASRQAWTLPSLRSAELEEMEWLKAAADKLSFGEVVKIAGLEGWEQLPGHMERHGITTATRAVQRREFLPPTLAFFTDSSVKAELLRRAAAQRDLLSQYLAAQGADSSIPWGIVDLGWAGSLQKALARILDKSVTGFYFGLSPGPGKVIPENAKAYFGSPSAAGGFRLPVARVIPLVESFCFAPHPSVTGYRQTTSGVEPSFAEDLTKPLLDWGLAHFQKAVRLVAEFLDPAALHAASDGDIRPAVAEVLERFHMRPTADEARCWGAQPWEDGVGSRADFVNRAKPLGWLDFCRDLLGVRKAEDHRAMWQPGCVAISRAPVRSGYRFLRAIRKMKGQRLRGGSRINARTRG